MQNLCPDSKRLPPAHGGGPHEYPFFSPSYANASLLGRTLPYQPPSPSPFPPTRAFSGTVSNCTTTGESKEGESANTAMAGLNLLASLLGAPAMDGAGTGGGGDEGAGGDAKRRESQRDSFKINLFPDDPFDGAQAKGGDDDDDDEVCARGLFVPLYVCLYPAVSYCLLTCRACVL